MNDAQSTIVGLKAQDCPGGGWTGQPAELERATVADCLAHGVCGCIYGGTVQHIERLRAALDKIAKMEPSEIAPETFPGLVHGSALLFANSQRIAREALRAYQQSEPRKECDTIEDVLNDLHGRR